MRKKLARNMITPNIREKLQTRKRILDDFMTSENVTFKVKVGETITTSFVHCEDIEGLVDFVCDWRELERDQVEIVIGIDNGKGKLIMTMNCVVKTLEENTTTYQQDVKRALSLPAPKKYPKITKMLVCFLRKQILIKLILNM